MARLSTFKVDSRAIESGEWVSPGDEYDDLQILTRGFTNQYTDARAAKLRRTSLGFNGDASKIPSAMQRAITVECMISHVLLDVRNLSGDDGQPVNFATFCTLLRDPDFGDLLTASIKAASQVGQRRAVDTEEAAGNSVTPSAPPSATGA